MKESELTARQTAEMIPATQEVASLHEKASDVSHITHLIDVVRQTASHSLPRNELIHTGNLKSPRESGIPFYIAAKVLEQYGNERALPERDEVKVLTASENRQKEVHLPTDTLEDITRKLKQNDPYEALVLRTPWNGVVKSHSQDMFSHLPSTLSIHRRERLRKLGEKELHKKGDSSKDNGETAYSYALWETLFSVAGIDALGKKTLYGSKYENPHDYQQKLEMSISTLTNEATRITKEQVIKTAEQRVKEDLESDPTQLIQDKSLAQTYVELTGDSLWDHRTIEKTAGFFMDYFTNRNMQLTWTNKPEERSDTMIAAFVNRWVGEGDGTYSIDTLGNYKMPRSAVSELVRDRQTEEITDLDAYLRLNDALDPVLSNLTGRPVEVSRIQKDLAKFFYKRSHGMNGEIKIYKTPEEIIQSAFVELGIQDTNPTQQLAFLAHSASEIKGWLGAAKHMDHHFTDEAYFKQMLAIKVFLDVALWKAGVEKQGWVPGHTSYPVGHVSSLTEYFSNHPEEWTYRRYGDIYEDWNTHHIETPKPHEYFDSRIRVNDDLEKYKSFRPEKERYQLGVKQLIEAGKLPGTNPSLEYVLKHELFPIHQLFASLGASPETMRVTIESITDSFPHTLSSIDKMREAAKYIRSLMSVDTFKLRYETQHEFDTQLSDRIMSRVIEHVGSQEVDGTIKQQILEVDCGDSRNEARRVALENATENIATIGAAGHFGIPYDVIRVTPRVSEEVKKPLRDIFATIIQKGEGNMSREDISVMMKKVGAETVEQANELWETFKHFIESPFFLANASYKYPGFTTTALALDMTNFVLGPYAEYISPGIHQKIEHWVENNSVGELDYSVDIMKLPSEKYSKQQTKLEELRNNAYHSNEDQAWQDLLIYENDLQKEIGADYVEQFLTMTGLDVKKWTPAVGESKLLAIAGHESKVHTNNLDRMAYECGACGGHSGERNAVLLASYINDTDVRNTLRSRGIDMQNIYAVGGIYNTTTSNMEWHVPKEFQNNDTVTPLLTELQNATSIADTEARMLHEELLTNGVEYSLISKLKSHTSWRSLSSDVKDQKAVEGNVHFRSVNPGAVQPEGGHVWTGAVVYGRRDYFRGFRADEDTTTFHVNSATDELIPPGSIDVFAGVYEGIRGEYYSGHLNRESAPFKAQQSWYFTGKYNWSLDSAGNPDIFGGLTRQLFNGRRGPATRPNYNFVAKLDSVKAAIEKTPQLQQILDLGYGIGTVYDPEERKVYRYESSAHKAVITGNVASGTWEPVNHLNSKIQKNRIGDQVTEIFVKGHRGGNSEIVD